MDNERKQKREILKRLKEKKAIIKDRVDLLEQFNSEIKDGNMPLLDMGGLVSDLFKLNPVSNTKLVPLLLELYKEEIKLMDNDIAIAKTGPVSLN